jgi:hypothetical protein
VGRLFWLDQLVPRHSRIEARYAIGSICSER